MSDPGLKLYLPLLIHYVHTGSEGDFPIRVAVSFSSHFGEGGKDVDVILTKFEQINSTGVDHAWGKDYGYHLIEVLVSPKLRPSNGQRLLHPDAELVVSVFCRISNEHGRETWRNGGASHFLLSEILCNGISSSTPDKITFTRRKVYVSAYNVPKEDRLTGIVSVATSPKSSKYFEPLYVSKGIRKWIPSLVATGSDNKKFFCVICSTRKTIPIETLSTGTFFKRLYNLEFTCDSVECHHNNNNNHPTWGWKSVPKSSLNDEDTESWKTRVEDEWGSYKDMLNGLDSDMLKIDLKGTARMRCPWVPMDTVVKEFGEDYSKPWYKVTTLEGIGGRENENKDQNRCIVTRNQSVATKQLWSRESALLIPSCNIEVNSVGEKETKQNDTNSHFNYCYGELNQVGGDQKKYSSRETYAASEIKFIMSDPEMESRTLYLPYPFFLCHQPLRVYKDYWEVALLRLAQRMDPFTLDDRELELSRFESYFFDPKQTSPQLKADLTFRLISMYSQCIEYISDYCKTKSKKGDGGKVSVEQFGNSQRSMSADCEDSSGGIGQFYCNFINEDESNSWVRNIRGNKVLCEMRRILRHNYVAVFNIDGVYLPKQTGNNEDESRYTMYSKGMVETEKEFWYLKRSTSYSPLSDRQKDMINDFYSDSKDTNSAHASIKMLPKTYFERCVNRSYEQCDSVRIARGKVGPSHRRAGTGPFFIKCTEVKGCFCFYHKYSPDSNNELLPVGFLEGTSMGRPDENADDTCTEEKFREALMSDPVINDVTKVPIYSKTKGESGFYRVSFFGALLFPDTEFVKSYNVGTFVWCRPNPRSLRVESALSEKPFLRAISHKQLSFKSDQVILLPYGHKLEDPFSFETTKRSGACDHIRFDFTEMSDFVKDLCLSECCGRMRSRKVSNNGVTLGNSKMRGVTLYNTQLHDSGRSFHRSEELLSDWRFRLNSRYSNKTGRQPHHQKEGFLTFHWDNYYITFGFLRTVEDRIEDLVENKGWRRHFSTNFTLERLSDDMCTWKVDFVFEVR